MVVAESSEGVDQLVGLTGGGELVQLVGGDHEHQIFGVGLPVPARGKGNGGEGSPVGGGLEEGEGALVGRSVLDHVAVEATFDHPVLGGVEGGVVGRGDEGGVDSADEGYVLGGALEEGVGEVGASVLQNYAGEAFVLGALEIASVVEGIGGLAVVVERISVEAGYVN